MRKYIVLNEKGYPIFPIYFEGDSNIPNEAIEITDEEEVKYLSNKYFNKESGKFEDIPVSQEEQNKAAAAAKKAELQSEASVMMLSVLAGGSLEKVQKAYSAKIEEIPNDVAVYIPEVFPLWSGASVKYEKGKRVQYNGVLYEVVKEHVSQENWKPDITPSEYAKVISSISGEIPEWEQPLPTNAYKKGDRVKHNGRYYESTYDGANVWEPGVVGEEYWKDITDEIGEAS